MFRHNRITHPVAILAVMLALPASLAFADDSSMSVLTGDSYAFFHNLDYSPGRFNTARAPAPQERDAVVRMPRQTPEVAEKPVMLAGRPGVTLRSPFRDDTGA
jgi:hypothetical protein